MPDFNYAKGRIAESIQFIAREMKEFEVEYAKSHWQDYQSDNKLQKLIDRTVENILTAFIEVCGTVVAEKGIAAENYGQVIREAAKLFGLNEAEQNSLAQLAAQRNRLAHRYLDFKWQAVRFYAEQSQLIEKLLKLVLAKEAKLF